tara:strand:- start:509 stop:904 length:396 start_codon:yes stop_codon:yes gene_type:complete
MGIVADVASFGMQRAQGSIARGQSEVAAQAEEAAGVSRESDRKGRLAEALAAQNASAGTSGIAAFEGSPLSVMKEDVRREKVATERDAFQTKLKSMTLRAGGKIAERQAKSGANIGLITSIEDKAIKAIGG